MDDLPRAEAAFEERKQATQRNGIDFARPSELKAQYEESRDWQCPKTKSGFRASASPCRGKAIAVDGDGCESKEKVHIVI
jgi:hypothetical protein